MSTSLENLTSEQILILKEFRKALSDILKPIHDDKFILRFLIARNFDLNKAEAMIRKSIKWRQIVGADFVLATYKIPEVCKKYIPEGFLGFDREGSAVSLLPQGTIDLKGLVASTRRLDFVKVLITLYEFDIYQMKVNNKKTGQNTDKFVMILDYEGFSLRQIASKAVMDLIFEIVQVFEGNYPERLKAAYLINVPYIFWTFYAGIKPFLAEETKKKIRIYGKNNFKEDLVENIGADILPAYLGGNRVDPDGDPRCPSIISQGGIIPESYYLKNQPRLSKQPETNQVIIDYKSVHLIEIHVSIENSMLVWEIETEDTDIGVGLLYLNKNCSSGEDENSYPAEELLPIERLSCQIISGKGSYQCDNPGYYILQLDNSFGKFHQKTTVYYQIEVTPPGDVEEILKNASVSTD